MKRGGPDHPKTGALARRLGIERYAAVGLLECLWHWAARYAKRGDVGRFSDSDIADGCFWTDEPTVLIHGLVETGWLDESAEHRLVIHDWSKHADDAVRKAIEREGQTFADNVATKSRQVPTKSRQVPTESAENTPALAVASALAVARANAVAVASAARPEAAAAPSGGVPPDADLPTLVALVRSCRPEFASLPVAGIENALRSGPVEAARAAVADFIQAMVNSLELPRVPAKLLAGYVSKAAEKVEMEAGKGGMTPEQGLARARARAERERRER